MEMLIKQFIGRALMGVLASFLCVSPAIAQSDNADSFHQQQASDLMTRHFNMIKSTCPQLADLHYKNLRWYGPGSWKSQNQSFVRKIDVFTGAQWIGINVGQVICVYRGRTDIDFPVTLSRTYLVGVPAPYQRCLGSKSRRLHELCLE